MKCQACSGRIAELAGIFNLNLDQRGVCENCSAVYVADNRTILAKTWCKCPQTSIPQLAEKQTELRESQEVFFFTDSGEHGWLHTTCGQITQTG